MVEYTTDVNEYTADSEPVKTKKKILAACWTAFSHAENVITSLESVGLDINDGRGGAGELFAVESDILDAAAAVLGIPAGDEDLCSTFSEMTGRYDADTLPEPLANMAEWSEMIPERKS